MDTITPPAARPMVAAAALLRLTTAADVYLFGRSGEPLTGPVLDRARADLAAEIERAWDLIRPPGVPAETPPGEAATGQVPPAIDQMVAGFKAARWAGVIYHPENPQRAAIEAAARRHGLVPVPGLEGDAAYRTVRGCPAPPKAPDAAATAALARALHARCRLASAMYSDDPPPPLGHDDNEDELMAAFLLVSLTTMGYELRLRQEMEA